MRLTLLSLFAAGLAFVALRPPSLDHGPGFYRSRRGSDVYFDRAAFAAARGPLVPGSPLLASRRAGRLERRGAFRVEEVVEGGVRVTILTGDWTGRTAWIRRDELTLGRNGKLWKLDESGAGPEDDR
jgi:hypothetical protein